MPELITLSEIRDQSTIGAIADLSDDKLDLYQDRAYHYIRRYTGQSWRRMEYIDEDLLFDLKRAIVLMVEYIWYSDQPAVKESEFAGLESENIGTYSYNKGDKEGPTGNAELNQILDNLRGSVGFNLFSVNGPSKGYNRPYSPHAYVSGYWRDDE